MRSLLVAFILVAAVVVPAPASANHDASDDYATISFGDDGALYIDDGFPPMIYRESNGFEGLQRGFDGSGHAGHGNHDQRIF